jgi:hypothetical protein
MFLPFDRQLGVVETELTASNERSATQFKAYATTHRYHVLSTSETYLWVPAARLLRVDRRSQLSLVSDHVDPRTHTIQSLPAALALVSLRRTADSIDTFHSRLHDQSSAITFAGAPFAKATSICGMAA